MNRLYYGDNLDVLRRHVEDESVDLVYLDPPFNSNANYNVLFAEHDGTKAASQIKAFEDTWEWDEAAARAYEEVVEQGGRVSQAMQAFRTFLGDSDMLAYLAMMAPRLVELRRVLKPTGSLYLHCDPTASHYLKMLLDAVFGPEMFLNEIIWKRTSSHNASRRYGPVHDTILFYSKSAGYVWNTQYEPYSQDYIESEFRKDADGRFVKFENLTGAGTRQGSSGLPWKGIDPTKSGRHWAISGRILKLYGLDDPSTSTQQKLDALLARGRIKTDANGVPRMRGLKTYLDELPGAPLQSVWTELLKVGNTSQERLGYPTQKPEALLDRIIAASSNEGDLVLDPFCGCGTAIASAQKMKRRWIGIDITHLAITLIRSRLTDTFGGSVPYEVVGEPVSLPDATALAESDPYQFQWWALGLVDARPVEQKKGADKGIDGRIYFHEGPGQTKQIVLSVKAGKLHATHVRDLGHVVNREKAAIGVLIAMDEPTRPMKAEAASAGFYTSPWGKHPRLQILTIEQLLAGEGIDRPPAQASVTFKRAPKATARGAQAQALDFSGEQDD